MSQSAASAHAKRPGDAMHTPSPALPIYVRSVIAIGAAAIVWSLPALLHIPHTFVWLLFTALALLTGRFTMKIASLSANISVTDTFFIASAIFFGPAPATIAVAINTSIVSSRRGHSRERIAFNTAAPALAMWLASHAFFLFAKVPPLAQTPAPVAQIIGPLIILTATYFLFNSGLMALAIGFDTRQSALTIWHRHFLWLSLSYLAAASVAFCLVVLIQQVSLAAAAMVLPLLIIFHLTLSSSFGRLEDARRHLGDMDHLYLSTVETLAMAIDAKDDVTHNHVRRVQAYAMGLAKELGVVDELMLKAIEAAALLHDTGKLAVPEHILNKPGKLTASEFEQMKLHVDVGADILSLVEFPYPVVPIVRCHHESWDGSGYPRGVSGEDIPIGARILSVVDCFDALTSDRPYRAAMTSGQAFDILRERSGKMYDPRVVEKFIAIQPSIAPDDAETSARQHVIQQIVRSGKTAAPSAASESPAAAPLVVPDDVLAFVSLSRLASGEHTVADVLALASTLLRDTAAPSTAAWYLHDAATDALVVAHASGPAAEAFRGLSMAVGSRLSGWVAAHRQPIVNSDPGLDLGTAAAVSPALLSCLSVPLVTGESLVGVLSLYSSQPKAFTDDQGRLVQMIAPHVANAVSRARRHEAAASDALPPIAERRPAGGPLRLVANGSNRAAR
jgi:putative nucleotidyltransferase with HDIG domain